MSAFSTLRITRGTALRYLHEHLQEATDEMLGNIMDDLLKESLRNVLIVQDGPIDDHSLFGDFG